MYIYTYLYLYIYIYIYVCDIWIFVYIYIYISIYTYLYTFSSFFLEHCKIYYFVSQCMLSYALHDLVFNLLEINFFNFFLFVVYDIIIEHNAIKNFEKYKHLKSILGYT